MFCLDARARSRDADAGSQEVLRRRSNCILDGDQLCIVAGRGGGLYGKGIVNIRSFYVTIIALILLLSSLIWSTR